MMEEENIEQLFREQFSGFSVPPPAEVKAAIDREIRGRRRPFFWIFGTVVIFGLGYCAMWLFTALDAPSVSPNAARSAATNYRTEATAASGQAPHKPTSPGDNRPDNANNYPVMPGETTYDESGAPVSVHSSPTATRGGSAASKGTKTMAADHANSRGKAATGSRSESSGNLPDKSILTEMTSGNTTSVRPGATGNAENPLDDALNREREASENGEIKTASSDKNPGLTKDTVNTAAQKATDATENADPQKDSSNTTSNTATTAGKPSSPSGDSARHWYAEVKPGLAINSLSKGEVKTASIPAFGINGGLYRELNLGPLSRAGIDLGYAGGNFTWAKDTTIYSSQTLDSLYTYFNQQDSTWHTDTIYYTTTTSSSQLYQYRSTFSQFAVGLSTQFDLELTDGLGIVVSPAFRYARTKFVRNSDAKVFQSGSFQLNLGLDVYYDRRYWRFLAGIGYGYTWIKPADNPLNGKGSSLLMPRIGVGFRF